MSDPITSVSAAPATYPAYDPEIGDYSSYKPLAKTAWSKDGSGQDGLSFSDFLDVINPLQHLPIISTLYRAITGDTIGLAAKLAGDALYGGPIGLLASGATAALEGIAGESTGDMLAELAHDVFGPSSGDAPAATQEARALDSEQAHESDLAAMTQAATAQAAPVIPPPALAHAKTAPTPAAKPDTVSMNSDDEASQRIAKSIAEARRAQAGLLLASLQQAEPTTRAARSDETTHDKESKPAAQAKPNANPYLPPDQPSASANWSNESLAEAISRYERAVAANRH